MLILSGSSSLRRTRRLTPGSWTQSRTDCIFCFFTAFVSFLTCTSARWSFPLSVCSIEYWFRCMDMDGDGVLSMYELEYFYEEQCQKLEAMAIEPLPFEDCLCQMLDLVKPEVEGQTCFTWILSRVHTPESLNRLNFSNTHTHFQAGSLIISWENRYRWETECLIWTACSQLLVSSTPLNSLQHLAFPLCHLEDSSPWWGYAYLVLLATARMWLLVDLVVCCTSGVVI